jgi:hypothetical protein
MGAPQQGIFSAVVETFWVPFCHEITSVALLPFWQHLIYLAISWHQSHPLRIMALDNGNKELHGGMVLKTTAICRNSWELIDVWCQQIQWESPQSEITRQK